MLFFISVPFFAGYLTSTVLRHYHIVFGFCLMDCILGLDRITVLLSRSIVWGFL